MYRRMLIGGGGKRLAVRRQTRPRGTALPSPDGMGSVAGDLWGIAKSEAKKAGTAAVKGVSQSIGDRLRTLVGVPTATAGRTKAAAMSYLPWAAGAGGALLLGYLLMRRHA